MTETIRNLPWMKEQSVATQQKATDSSPDVSKTLEQPYIPPIMPASTGIISSPEAVPTLPSPPQTAKKGFSLYSSIKWGTLGFVAGIAFWNIISFWSFVGQAVFAGPQEPSAHELAMRDNAVNMALPRKDLASIAPDENAARKEALKKCVALEIDRVSKQTNSMPCRQVKSNWRKNGQRKTAARTDKF